MSDLQALVEKAKQSELFTAPRLEADIAAFLQERKAQLKSLADEALKTGVEHVYFVGSGGSWANMFSGKYFLDRYSTLTSDAFTSYELTWRKPRRLNEKAWVFFASYSGNTEDTVAALRHAKSRGAKTLVFCKRKDPPSTLMQEADVVLDYASTALYILPLAGVYLFALELARLQGNDEVEPILEGIDLLPTILGEVFREAEAKSKDYADQLKDSNLLYILGAGPMYGLAYKFGLTVFMENMRVHSSVIESSEFRHGPVEALDKQKGDFVFLLGYDETRDMTRRVIETVKKREGNRVLVFDVADYPVHPMLAPFVMLIPLQWFVVYSALLRGIHDLDERAYMGRGVLATGGATWP